MALDRLVRVLPMSVLIFLVTLFSAVCAESPDQAPLQQSSSIATAPYRVGDAIPITCLNRTIDTGEHVEDEATGQLQYIPFWTCNETGRPLELYFGTERDVNCTIDMLTDEMYHQLEFYIHNDAPLTCRIPSRRLDADAESKSKRDTKKAASGAGSNEGEAAAAAAAAAEADEEDEQSLYTPLTISLNGLLQRSHLHVSNALNVVLHAAPRLTAPGTIDAATAYSVSSSDSARAVNTKIIIGDPLPLRLSVRWYPDTRLPPSWRGGGVGGHFYFSTLVYCLISAGVSAVVCIAYFRGIDLPRRLKSYGQDSLGMSWLGRRDALPMTNNAPKYNGYGYGVSTGVGNGWGVGPGKRD